MVPYVPPTYSVDNQWCCFTLNYSMEWCAIALRKSRALLICLRFMCSVHITLKPAACIFSTPFLKTISLFSKRFFFQKMFALYTVNIQERFLIKRGLSWHAYGIWNNIIDCLPCRYFVFKVNARSLRIPRREDFKWNFVDR